MCTPHDSLLDFRARGEHSVPVTRRCQWAARQHPGGDATLRWTGWIVGITSLGTAMTALKG